MRSANSFKNSIEIQSNPIILRAFETKYKVIILYWPVIGFRLVFIFGTTEL